jgi:hypothetical protein
VGPCREVEDVAALITAVGSGAALCSNSDGKAEEAMRYNLTSVIGLPTGDRVIGSSSGRDRDRPDLGRRSSAPSRPTPGSPQRLGPHQRLRTVVWTALNCMWRISAPPLRLRHVRWTTD